MRNSRPTNIPYTYLTRPDEYVHQYKLFVSMVLAEGYQINDLSAEQEVQYLNGLTQITLHIIRKDEASGGDINRMFTLEPADSIPTGFFPDTDQIQISVQVYEDDANLVEEFHFGLFYRDSDDQAISAEEEQLQKSFNCPYVYLEAASGRTEEDS